MMNAGKDIDVQILSFYGAGVGAFCPVAGKLQLVFGQVRVTKSGTINLRFWSMATGLFAI